MDRFEYATTYFDLHAKQRMTTFNFYLIINAFLITAFVSSYTNEFELPQVRCVISGAGIFISFVFRKLDGRVRDLIHHAENELKILETKNPAFPQLHSSGPSTSRRHVLLAPLTNPFSYSQSFCLVFLLFGLLGTAGAAVSIRGLI